MTNLSVSAVRETDFEERLRAQAQLVQENRLSLILKETFYVWLILLPKKI